MLEKDPAKRLDIGQIKAQCRFLNDALPTAPIQSQEEGVAAIKAQTTESLGIFGRTSVSCALANGMPSSSNLSTDSEGENIHNQY